MGSEQSIDRIGRPESTVRTTAITHHVLRNNSAGITIYMQAPREEMCGGAWPYRKPYAIAYETETEGGRQQRQLIAETDSAEALQAVLALIQSHVYRIKRRLLPRVLERRAIGPRQIAECSGFRTNAVRLEVLGNLATLCKTPFRPQAYTGFMNSVYSSIDDWLSAAQTCGVEMVEDAHLACDWVQGLTLSAPQER